MLVISIYFKDTLGGLVQNAGDWEGGVESFSDFRIIKRNVTEQNIFTIQKHINSMVRNII